MKELRIVIIMFTLLSVGCANHPSPLSYLCNYSIRDYGSVRDDFVALLPKGTTLDVARTMLASIGILNLHSTPLIRNKGKLFLAPAQPENSNEKFLGGTIDCTLSNQNKDRWGVLLYVGQSGTVEAADIEIAILDENFAQRNISLSPRYIIGNEPFSKALRSLSVAMQHNWSALQKNLTNAGFHISETQRDTKGLRVMKITKPMDVERLDVRILGAAISTPQALLELDTHSNTIVAIFDDTSKKFESVK